MPFDRKQWIQKINLTDSDRWPDWLCSECKQGYFHPPKKDNSEGNKLIAESSKIKYLRHNDPGIDIHNYYGHTALKLECNNHKCTSESLLIGKSYSEEHYLTDDNDCPYEIVYIDYLEPIFFTIPPQVISIPEINEENFNKGVKFLYQSFKIFFDDPSSAANKIRIFLEYLVPKTTNNSGKLHDRLEKYLKEANPHILELLKASKWIGNDASHEGDITHEDVLDAYEFIEYALSLMYPEDRSTLLHKASNINDNKKSSSKIN